MNANTKVLFALIFCLIALGNRCLAQRVVSLRTYEEMIARPDSAETWIDQAMYIKDTENELNRFAGVWKGSSAGRFYEISLVKKINYKIYPNLKKSRDLLMGWIIVKDINGNLIYTNTAKKEDSNGFVGDNFQVNTNIYRFNFYARCKDDFGLVFIRIDAATGKMKLHFACLDDIMATNYCPNGYVPVLPGSAEGLLLTKQP